MRTLAWSADAALLGTKACGELPVVTALQSRSAYCSVVHCTVLTDVLSLPCTIDELETFLAHCRMMTGNLSTRRSSDTLLQHTLQIDVSNPTGPDAGPPCTRLAPCTSCAISAAALR